MDWLSAIEAAALRVEGYVRQTPVMQADAFGLGYPIGLKLEQLQVTEQVDAPPQLTSQSPSQV